MGVAVSESLQAPHFVFHVAPHWPPLSWIAQCQSGLGRTTVFHGARVEATDEWFCEAAWAGDYSLGGFDQTDIITGSGARIRDDRIVFVSSGSIHDQLYSLDFDDGVWVSNSLCCLLAAADLSPDIPYKRYHRDFETRIYALDERPAGFRTAGGAAVEPTCFDNLVWDGQTLRPRPKPGGDSDFSSFSRYRDFLASAMRRLSANISDRRRRHPYDMLSTLSSGYDSPTVAVLAREAGCTEAVSFDVDRDGRDDSGKAIAGLLGIDCHHIVQRDAWRSAAMPEVPFVACSGSIGDVLFRGAEDLLFGKVLLTGVSGIWQKEKVDLSHGAGLGLAEYRLWAGFLHCPVTMWGARQFSQIKAISNSAEMEPWDLPSPYSRPICRRIVEEAGVPRSLFGIKKKGLSVARQDALDHLVPESRDDYLGWLTAHRHKWIERGRLPPLQSVGNLMDRVLPPAAELLARHSLGPVRRRARSFIKEYPKPRYARNYTIPWAVERAKQRYPRPD